MANYVFAYTGGTMADTDAARQASLAAWGTWFGTLGTAVVDAGNPFGPAVTIATDGSVSEGGSARLSGYSILAADSLGAATTLAKDCPVLANGGAVEVYEIFPAM